MARRRNRRERAVARGWTGADQNRLSVPGKIVDMVLVGDRLIVTCEDARFFEVFTKQASRGGRPFALREMTHA